MDIAGLLVTIKAATASVTKLREITKKMQQAELKLTIADLANQLADAQHKVAELKDEILKLQDENKALKAKAVSEKPKVKWGCYQFEGDERLYCPGCYDTKGKKHLTTRINSHLRTCSVCRTQLGS
jgi:cell division protein FtsB